MTIEKHMVYPTKKYNLPSVPSNIKTQAILDNILEGSTVHNHRFYHSTTKPLSFITDTMISSLAEALELYPPVAGTVKCDKNGIWQISTEAVGTPFFIQIKNTPFVSDSVDLSPRLFPLEILPPSLVVKITQFSCGTIVLATSLNHQIADLCGSLAFFKLWAQLSRGEVVDLSIIPTDWSRNTSRFFDGFVKSGEMPPEPFMMLPTPIAGPPPSLKAPLAFNKWIFTKKSIENLKKDFSPSEPGQWISSGDALVALLSGAITRARENGNIERLEGRSSLESQTEIIAFCADAREKAPKGDMTNTNFFGNFLMILSATISRSDLLSLTLESASRVALTIRNTIQNGLLPESIGSSIGFFDDPKNNSNPSGRIIWKTDIGFTNWCKFDLKSVDYDFGWGKPFLASEGLSNIFFPGFGILMQGRDSGDVNVVISVEEKAADILKNDPILNRYAIIEPVSGFK